MTSQVQTRILLAPPCGRPSPDVCHHPGRGWGSSPRSAGRAGGHKGRTRGRCSQGSRALPWVRPCCGRTCRFLESHTSSCDGHQHHRVLAGEGREQRAEGSGRSRGGRMPFCSLWPHHPEQGCPGLTGSPLPPEGPHSLPPSSSAPSLDSHKSVLTLKRGSRPAGEPGLQTAQPQPPSGPLAVPATLQLARRETLFLHRTRARVHLLDMVITTLRVATVAQWGRSVSSPSTSFHMRPWKQAPLSPHSSPGSQAVCRGPQLRLS